MASCCNSGSGSCGTCYCYNEFGFFNPFSTSVQIFFSHFPCPKIFPILSRYLCSNRHGKPLLLFAEHRITGPCTTDFQWVKGAAIWETEATDGAPGPDWRLFHPWRAESWFLAKDSAPSTHNLNHQLAGGVNPVGSSQRATVVHYIEGFFFPSPCRLCVCVFRAHGGMCNVYV